MPASQFPYLFLGKILDGRSLLSKEVMAPDIVFTTFRSEYLWY